MIFPHETGAALTGLSVKPATAMVATAMDEATRKDPARLRNLLVKEFLNIGVSSNQCEDKYGGI